MSTDTLIDEQARPGEPSGQHTPRVELDVPVALTAIQTAGLQAVRDSRGGTVLDIRHPGVAPLLPYLPAAGPWMWVADRAGVAAVRQTSRPADTVVLDGRARPEEASRESDADLVVLPVDHLERTRTEPPRVASLLDVTALPQYRIRPRLLAAPAQVAGFHLDLTGMPSSAMAQAMDTLGHAMRRWQVAGRHDRPLLVLRGTHTLLARWVADGLKLISRTGGVLMPVMRVDVTPTVLDVAVRTVLRVVDVNSGGSKPILEVDGLPPATAAPLHVLQPERATAVPTDVLLRHHGMLVRARLVGRPVRPGSELAAAGWTMTERGPVVLGCSTRQTS
jgi:hypothetical protein